MEHVGIFAGKQKAHNILVLNLLFDNGPLTVWEMTAKIRAINRQSLHSTLNKRLRILEKKGYVKRDGTKWILPLKGMIATLLILPEPRKWSEKWAEVFDKKTQVLKTIFCSSRVKITLDDKLITTGEITNGLDFLRNSVDSFEAWVGLSKIVKGLIEKGVINLDLIGEKALLGVVISEANQANELPSALKEPNNEE